MKKDLILKIFEAFTIQRWNDKIRPVELIEMDKHAHKMIIAYCLGKYEEMCGKYVDWEKIINGGIFELFRRIRVSDMKSPIYRKIRFSHPEVFRELNRWVFDSYKGLLEDDKLMEHFRLFLEDRYLDTTTSHILEAAHIYSSFLEFQIIKNINPKGYDIDEISITMSSDVSKYKHLEGMKKIISGSAIAHFIELCGQLRYQIRWAHSDRLPATSVLGHMMLVAVTSYFLTRKLNPCPKRLYNNFFGGLFHDLPEAVTRDIISPVKSSIEGMPAVITEIEKELADEKIFPLIEPEWHDELRYFIDDEFDSKINIAGIPRTVSSDEINSSYNKDGFSPIDGELIRAADHLGALLETYKTAEIGLTLKPMEAARESLKNKYRSTIIGGLHLGEIFSEF